MYFGWKFFHRCVREGQNMQDKYSYGLWGVAAGALAVTVVGFGFGGWSTSGGTAKQVEIAVLAALIPSCVRDVMADSIANAELKTKRASDYDDVVRDYRKRASSRSDLGYQFNRDCGKAIEATMAKAGTKS
jgi:hypothetical protein